MSILVVVAHPDDESLAMGGTIATLTQAGERVTVVALADGVGARLKWYQWFARWEQRCARAEMFHRACRHLGAEGRLLRVFPDQRADCVPQLAINKAVERVISAVAPYEVYTHWKGDLNLDHRAVAEAVMVATRPGSTRYVRRVYAMTPEFPALAFQAWKPKKTQTLEDEPYKAKLNACYCYHGEFRPAPHPRSFRALSDATVEGFMVIR